MDEKLHTCPKCGAIMKPQELNGSSNLDGTTDMSGFYCPNCDKQTDKSENSND